MPYLFDWKCQHNVGDKILIMPKSNDKRHLFNLYKGRLNASPLTRVFKHVNTDAYSGKPYVWVLWAERALGKGAYTIEALERGGGASRDPGQSFFHSIENKSGGQCVVCCSALRWDQKHDELICIDCGLVYSDVPEELTPWLEDRDFVVHMTNEEDYIEAYDDRFIEYYNPMLANSVLPDYGHLSDNELDLMLGWRNRKLIREINNPTKNPIVGYLKPFRLSELGSKGYDGLHEGIFGDLLGRPTKVPLSRIRLDPLIKEKPSINMVSNRIKFSLEMNRSTKKPKRLLGISSEIALPETQRRDIYKLWLEQKKVEKSYNPHSAASWCKIRNFLIFN